MKINIEKNLVEFSPENAEETAKLEGLWKVIVDCVRFSRKLVPIGEYVPQKNNMARFAIEGEIGEGVDKYPEVYTESDCNCYCQTCNKYVVLRKGDQIPPCCGKLMEVLD
ncbi:hypothetical protein C6A37_04885 [Desulfobacteraceae bacterium SEEP-SAG9]|nr:hypothetical protein C6A37_04885 [Desulfobacteraceae bacterium SEEP-SAG9]